MTVVICPGIHQPELTESFLKELQVARAARNPLIPTQQSRFDSSLNYPKNLLIFPAQRLPVYSAIHVREFLGQHCSMAFPLVMICFSAGVVGGIGAAWGWQQAGGTIKAFMALDGWGVPLYGDFPIHRLSHDRFTHWSSQLLGAGIDSFYADPSVEHLELWRSPQMAHGWWGQKSQLQRTTAATFLTLLLERYGE
jgi:hypothetical protein